MPIEDAVREFGHWLEERSGQYERRLVSTHDPERRLVLKTEAAELHVIQAVFKEMVGGALAPKPAYSAPR